MDCGLKPQHWEPGHQSKSKEWFPSTSAGITTSTVTDNAAAYHVMHRRSQKGTEQTSIVGGEFQRLRLDA